MGRKSQKHPAPPSSSRKKKKIVGTIVKNDNRVLSHLAASQFVRFLHCDVKRRKDSGMFFYPKKCLWCFMLLRFPFVSKKKRKKLAQVVSFPRGKKMKQNQDKQKNRKKKEEKSEENGNSKFFCAKMSKYQGKRKKTLQTETKRNAKKISLTSHPSKNLFTHPGAPPAH